MPVVPTLEEIALHGIMGSNPCRSTSLCLACTRSIRK